MTGPRTPAASEVIGDLGAHPTAAEVGAAFRRTVDAGVTDLPLPLESRTIRAVQATRTVHDSRLLERWRGLAALGAVDLTVTKLAEAHADADAILAELGADRPGPGEYWGVWAAEPPGARLIARRVGSGWVLDGVKPWCSGSGSCTHGLVTAEAPDGARLFAVALGSAGGAGRRAVPTRDTSGWQAVGMAATDTATLTFDGVPARPVGGVGGYLDRPGFWLGAIGIAACWYGGARAVAAPLRARAARSSDPHLAAHLGAVDAVLYAARAALERAALERAAAAADRAARADADAVDRAGAGAADAAGVADRGERVARQVRAVVEAAATEVIDRVGRALGAGPLCTDGAHARRVADLTVYLRQSHAERDLAALGALAAAAGPDDREGDW